MRKIYYLIVVLFCCVVESVALAEVVESSCIARISTDPALGIHSTVARGGGRAGMGMGGYGMEGGMGGGYGGETWTHPAPNPSVIVDLIESYPVSGQAAREVFGKTLTELDSQLEIKIYQTNPEVAMIGLHVRLGLPTEGQGDEPASVLAERFLALTLENLRGVLQRMDDQIRGANDLPIAEAEAKVEELSHQVQMLKDQARALHEQAGTTALSPDHVIRQQESLERDVLDMKLELDVAQAMREQLSERIAQLTAEATDRAEQDEALAALRELMELKQEAMTQVARAVESGRASTIDLGNARAEIAEQRVRIAERRDQILQNMNGQSLADLNDQLNKKLLESDRYRALLQAHSARLDQMKAKDLLALAEEYEFVQQHLYEAQQQMKYHADRLMKYRSVVESMLKPQVIVIE